MNWYRLTITDDIPEGFAGITKAWFIKIRPQYKDDAGLLEHEKVHVRQFWRTLGFHALFTLLSKHYKLMSEVEAYSKQLDYPPASQGDQYKHTYAGFISTKYGLDITEEEAYKLL